MLPSFTPPARDVVVPQIVSTRGWISNALVSNGNMATECRVTATIGQRPCCDVQVVLTGFQTDSNGGGDLPMPNYVAWQAAIERVSPNKAVLAAFNGQTQITSQIGSGVILSDPIGLDFAANETIKIQVGQQIASTSGSYLSPVNLVGLTDGYRAATAVSQIGTAGTWSATGRTPNYIVGTSPMLVGRPDKNYVAVIILGDSILSHRDDTTGDAYGNHGFVERGLFTAGPGGTPIPYANIGRAGERAATIANDLAAFRMSLLKYGSHVITNYGTNDFALGGSTLSAVQGYLTAAWAKMKARGVKVWQVLILPRTTSTDNWATAANQAPIANFTVGGGRDQLNTWIKSQVGTAIDGVIDCNQYLEDQAHPGCWVTNGSAQYTTLDGIHPSSAGHALAVPAVTAAAATFVYPRASVRL